ncbi:MAG: branched chain amino acid: 2-keto-4-methylthiobutyrate aminotransferase [Rhodocyclaceae bacterium]|nr:branched chain amino acid: 2-keto-4-methylthiobutyrate aminotransferase [Rhodocyclaceae bacterium]
MSPFVADPVYLNGRFVPLAEATISPLDRGFLFGDGVYEVIPVYSRRPFRLGEHLHRLQSSLDGIRLANPLPREEWETVVQRLALDAPFEDQGIYLQVSRGADVKRDHIFPQGIPPTVFAFSSPLVTPAAAIRETGVCAITAEDNRWLRCDLKTVSLLANVLLRQAADDQGCAEALLIRDGFLQEGAASSIFVVRNGILLAPPKSHLMLPGITYDVVLELADRHGQPYEIREIPLAELQAADEIWMTSSTKEVLPITRLDGRPVGTGAPGPVGRQMWQWYQHFKTTVMRNG